MMSKEDAKVSEPQLPMPPVIEAFMGALEEWKGKKPDEPRGSNMFGDDSNNEDQIGSDGVGSCALVILSYLNANFELE